MELPPRHQKNLNKHTHEIKRPTESEMNTLSTLAYFFRDHTQYFDAYLRSP